MSTHGNLSTALMAKVIAGRRSSCSSFVQFWSRRLLRFRVKR
jgi:hypothetical protein